MDKEKISPWVIVFRVFFTIAVGACIVYIFGNSLEAGAVSSLRSQAVMRYMNAALDRIGLGPVSEHTVRKLAHFAEYCLEGLLLTLCLRVYTRRFVRHISWPLLGGLLTAVADETIQLYVAERSSQVSDVWIDFAGVVAGMCVSLVLLLIVRAITSFYSIKKENRRLREERDALRRSQKAARRSRQEDFDDGPDGAEIRSVRDYAGTEDARAYRDAGDMRRPSSPARDSAGVPDGDLPGRAAGLTHIHRTAPSGYFAGGSPYAGPGYSAPAGSCDNDQGEGNL